ncbi:MAG: Cof-type HAD-IIB family hydrolase [Clostridia bacterium]
MKTIPYQLIALDLDGTLLNDEKQISAANRKALQMAYDAGLVIVPSTGRFFEGLPEVVKEAAFLRYAITINGAEIYDTATKQALHRADMSLSSAERVWDYFESLPVIYDCYQDGWGWMQQDMYDRADAFVPDEKMRCTMKRLRTTLIDFRTEMHARNKTVQKTQAYFQDSNVRARVLDEMPLLFPNLEISSAASNNVEVNSNAGTKGNALCVLCKHLGISMTQVIAFGDGSNDISMLRTAGMGIAMGNAVTAAKQAARRTTLSNNEDGIAAALKELMPTLFL